MGRKDKKNIGDFEVSDENLSSKPQSVLLVERLIKNLLKTTIEDLQDDKAELTRFFSEFFDSTLSGAKERDQFVAAFQKSPPRSILGYARRGAELPVYATVMTEETEEEAFLGDHLSDERDGSEASEETGAFFDATYTVFVYANNPDMCAILYQFGKAVIHAGKGFLFSCGVLSVQLSGGELAPDDQYMPENMFVRALRVKAKHPFAAPVLKSFDPTRLNVAGIFASDVVVDGQRGGVKPIEGT